MAKAQCHMTPTIPRGVKLIMLSSKRDTGVDIIVGLNGEYRPSELARPTYQLRGEPEDHWWEVAYPVYGQTRTVTFCQDATEILHNGEPKPEPVPKLKVQYGKQIRAAINEGLAKFNDRPFIVRIPAISPESMLVMFGRTYELLEFNHEDHSCAG